jgi:hypothetical protein
MRPAKRFTSLTLRVLTNDKGRQVITAKQMVFNLGQI